MINASLPDPVGQWLTKQQGWINEPALKPSVKPSVSELSRYKVISGNYIEIVQRRM
jgi:hypothetical protein